MFLTAYGCYVALRRESLVVRGNVWRDAAAGALGGLAGGIDPRLPFWIAAALGLANVLYGWLILPESLPITLRHGASQTRVNALKPRPG